MFHRLKLLGRGRGPLANVYLIVLAWSVGNGALWFFLPQLAEKLTSNVGYVGVLLAIPAATALVVDIPLGDLTDKVGVRRVLLFGILGLTVAGFLFRAVSTTTSLILFLILFGLLYQLFYIPTETYVMDKSPKVARSEYLGGYTSMVHLGLSVGAVVAGYLLVSGMDEGIFAVSNMYVLACLVAGGLALLLFRDYRKMREGLVEGIEEVVIKDRVYFRELLDYRKLGSTGFSVLALTFIITLFDGMVWALEPLLYRSLGIQPFYGGIILAAFVVPLIVFEVPAGFLADRYGKRKMLFLGLFVSGVFSILFGFAQSPAMLFAFAFCATIGLAMVWPAMEGILADASDSIGRGESVGVWSISRDAGYAAGPFVGGVVAYYSSLSMPFILAGVVLILFAFVVASTRKLI